MFRIKMIETGVKSLNGMGTDVGFNWIEGTTRGSGTKKIFPGLAGNPLRGPEEKGKVFQADWFGAVFS